MKLGSIFVIGSILLLGTVATSQLVYGDGNDSPELCKGGPTDEWIDSETVNTYDAGAGNTVNFICMKSGDDSFDMTQHSALIQTDGTYGDGDSPDSCYEVKDMGTQVVTVEETGNAGCKDISHVDFFTSDGAPPGGFDPPVGGELLPIETTSLLLAGAQSFSWMIPVVLSIVGIGLVLVRRK